MAIKAVSKRLKHGNTEGFKDLLHRFLQYRDENSSGIPAQELEVEAFTPVRAFKQTVRQLFGENKRLIWLF
jgi:hypothetical protein